MPPLGKDKCFLTIMASKRNIFKYVFGFYLQVYLLKKPKEENNAKKISQQYRYKYIITLL